MTKKRNRNEKKSGSWTGALIGLVALVGIIWAGVQWSSNPRDLVSYKQYKESKIKATSQTLPDEDSNESLKSSSDTDPVSTASADILKAKTDAIQPVPNPPATDLPRKTLEHISKGMGLSEQGKYELAELEFEKAAELSPNSPEVFAIWGASHRMQDKFKGANKRFARAVELAPGDEEIVFNWAMSRLKEKNSEEAVKLFQRTIELAPKHFTAYNYLGKSYGLVKDYKNEVKAYKKALEIKEDFGQAHFNLAVTLSLMKEFDEAGPHFIRAIEIDPQFDKPFVKQFLVAMGLKNAGKKRDDLKVADKSKKKKTPEKKDDVADASAKKDDEESHEGSHKKKEAEGSEGSDNKIVRPITNIKGTVQINGEPVSPGGVVILETKSKLRVPNQESTKVKVFQRNIQFEPKNSVIMVGSTVNFVNDDREVHNIYSKSRGNQFNLGAMSAGSSREIRLDTPGPVILRCNLHKDMIGTLFIVPNGYYAEPDENGEYAFNKVKSQEYLMQFWHPRLAPEEVGANMKNMPLTGIDKTLDIKVESQSKPGEVHDLVDATDYNLLVTNIEKEMNEAIQNWKDGKKYLSHKRMLKTITYYFDGGGLKGAIAKSFSEKRSLKLEKSLDDVRKKIAGLKKGKVDAVTEAELKGMAERAVQALKTNVQELYARIAPDKPATKQ